MLHRSNIVPRPWGEGCRSWDFVDRPDMLIAQETMPPGACEIRHCHARARQFFFVLEGELEIEVEGVTSRLKQHEGLDVPPGAAHQVFNTSEENVHFLAIAHPTPKGDRVLCPQTSS